jgi:hypothetical protein
MTSWVSLYIDSGKEGERELGGIGKMDKVWTCRKGIGFGDR